MRRTLHTSTCAVGSAPVYWLTLMHKFTPLSKGGGLRNFRVGGGPATHECVHTWRHTTRTRRNQKQRLTEAPQIKSESAQRKSKWASNEALRLRVYIHKAQAEASRCSDVPAGLPARKLDTRVRHRLVSVPGHHGIPGARIVLYSSASSPQAPRQRLGESERGGAFALSFLPFLDPCRRSAELPPTGAQAALRPAIFFSVCVFQSVAGVAGR